MDIAPQTRVNWVYERLKRAIVSGELPPGTRLVAAELAQRWALSPTPLREAFQRLEAVGLVEMNSQRGARVAAVERPSAHLQEGLRAVKGVFEARQERGSVSAR
jgi:DNA-binding GntR family transcriptional regulator